MTELDQIPIVARHRGVGIHDMQSAERIEVVKRAIDNVYDEHDWDRLIAIAGDVTWPPEARLFASAKLEAVFQIATDERRVRPPEIDLARIHASVPALDSQRWRDPWVFGSLLDPGRGPGQPGAVKREVPLV
ncbi:MAG: hypothetical protein Q7T45_13920 [Bradyrhizobium sp.]|uniref:hypothetical protein n=1 Tax=Bradyrhizobium sp. TaxID=376 RepID=UPI00271B6913|nr:hypothetical protein [Bradyrhizobium sp.]MDO8398909.1 hypothetical protein [Bradyrhizobium sp.]